MKVCKNCRFEVEEIMSPHDGEGVGMYQHPLDQRLHGRCVKHEMSLLTVMLHPEDVEDMSGRKRHGTECQACGYKVSRRTRCKGCDLLTCGNCVEMYHCIPIDLEGDEGWLDEDLKPDTDYSKPNLQNIPKEGRLPRGESRLMEMAKRAGDLPTNVLAVPGLVECQHLSWFTTNPPVCCDCGMVGRAHCS